MLSDAQAVGNLLDAAISYAGLGWKVFALSGKRPATQNGFYDATCSASQLRQQFNGSSITGIGLRTGITINGDFTLYAVDIDCRHNGHLSLEALANSHGELPDTVCQETNDGHHYFFAVPKGKRIRSLGEGIDIKGPGGYVVIAPSLHPNGTHYTWMIDGNPLDGVRVENAPDWMLEDDAPREQEQNVDFIATGYLPPETVSELREALAFWDHDDYHEWIKAGQALHFTCAPDAFAVWEEFSSRSSKYDHREAVAKWGSFKQGNGSGKSVTILTIFKTAQERGWVNPLKNKQETTPNFTPSLIYQSPPPVATAAPTKDIETLPSKRLEDVAEWMQGSALRSTRQVAVTGALALASVVAGRLYATDRENFSSLLFAVIAKSGGGKDFIKKCINKALSEAELTELMGPSSFTSDAAIRTAFIKHPTKVFVVDEFGDKLRKALRDNNPNELAAFDAMKEVYSNANGLWAERGYSGGRDPDEARELKSNQVYNPAMTLVGLSTPDQFMSAMDGARMEGGFLNRFLIIDASDSPVEKRRSIDTQVPKWLSMRLRAIRKYGLNENNPLVSARNQQFDMVPSPRKVVANEQVYNLFFDAWESFEDAYKDDPLMLNLSARWHENAMRMAVAIAVFEDYTMPTITPHIAQWCLDFVRHHGQIFGALCRLNALDSDSEWDQRRTKALGKLRQAGEAGVTMEQMNRLRPFKSLKLKDRNELLADLEHMGLAFKKVEPGLNGHRMKTTWYAMAEDD